MILDSFEPHSLVFQIRYPDAPIIWDRAGAIAKAMISIWPGMKIKEGNPQKQVLASDSVLVETGIDISSVTFRGKQLRDAIRFDQVKLAFDVWRSFLELEEFDRVGIRYVFLKKFSSLKEANAEVFKLDLVKRPSQRVFDHEIEADKNSVEVAYRFQDDNAFTVLRIKAEEFRAEVQLDPLYFDDIVETSNVVRERQFVILDFDHGNFKPGPASKFRADEWLKGSLHLLRRDIEKVLKR